MEVRQNYVGRLWENLKSSQIPRVFTWEITTKEITRESFPRDQDAR